MRQHSILFALILSTALLSNTGTPQAEAGSPAPNKPGPDEVILHADPYFGSGAAYRFKLRSDMLQVTAYLEAHPLLNKNFRSIQVGSDVIATVYKARPGRMIAGYDGKQFLHSKTGIAPIYSILVVNRKSDGRADRGYIGLPFRVTVGAQWTTTFGGGHLHMDEYFVPQTTQQRGIRDLSSALLPEGRGADWITLRTGRFPTKSIAVIFFDQFDARGTNARSFPTDPGYAAGYSLHDYGYGDKARSLRITWKGPKNGSATIPGVAVPSVPIPSVPTQSVVPNVKGFWVNPIGWRYEFATIGKRFVWRLPVLKENGEGAFLNATDVTLKWTAGDGSKHGPIKGKVERDANWRATKITFGNGLVLRPAGATKKNPVTNLNGRWSSKYGKVDIQQQGPSIKGTLHYPGGGTASVQGTIQGKTIQVKWFANPLAHGHGTLAISPDGKRLSGPFTDVVSKGSDTWVLTR